ncbi:MAG: class I SAM-dependent methyltransferase [Thermoprotei archaeon]
MSLAPYDRTPKEIVQAMLSLAEVKPGELLVDVGCGDGAILLEAAKLGARAVGVDYERELVMKAYAEAASENLARQVQVVLGDYKSVRLSSADVVTLYLTSQGNAKVFEKLQTERRKKVRVVTHDFPLPGISSVKTVKVAYTPFDRRVIHLYVLP